MRAVHRRIENERACGLNHVAAGDEAATKKCLTGVGKWILSAATAIGTPLAVEFLKSYLP